MFKKLIIIFSLLTCACSSQAQVWTKMFDSVPTFFGARTHVVDTINNVLYLGGEFRKVNNTYYGCILKYNGISFDTLQNGVKDNPFLGWDVINSLQMFQGKLYAFGNFTKTGKYNCKYIGRWNGLSWDSVNFKPNSPVLHSDVYNNELYVAGTFDTIAGIRSNNVAKFDGTNWYSLSFPVGGATTAIKNYKGKLYLASYTGVWSFNGSVWTPLADSQGDMFRTIYGMTVIDSLLYIYGRFNSLGGVNSKGIVAFDGTKWYGFGQGLSYSGYEIINSVQKIDGKLHISGLFDKIEGIGVSNFTPPAQFTSYAVLDSMKWCIKSPPFDHYAMGVVKYNNNLYLYGAFKKCGADTVFGFVKWNGGNSSVVCSNTFSISYSYVGVSEQINFSNLRIYPNPLTDILKIDSDGFDSKEFRLEISDALGKVLYAKDGLENRNEIDLSFLANGIYFLKLQNLLDQKVFKIVKE